MQKFLTSLTTVTLKVKLTQPGIKQSSLAVSVFHANLERNRSSICPIQSKALGELCQGQGRWKQY